MQTLAEGWIKEGIERGIEQGRQEALGSLAVRQLQHRLGILDAETRTQISALPVEQLEQLGEALLDFSTRNELMGWLHEHAAGGTQ